MEEIGCELCLGIYYAFKFKLDLSNCGFCTFYSLAPFIYMLLFVVCKLSALVANKDLYIYILLHVVS